MFPESRNGTSDLKVAEALVFDENELLSLAKVSHITFTVDASGVESSASFGPTPSCNQHILDGVVSVIANVLCSVILKDLIDP